MPPNDIPEPEAYEVTAARFSVGGHIEKRKVTRIACQFDADTDGPDTPWLA